MTQSRATQEETYLRAFESFEKNGSSKDPSWAQSLRKDAITRFSQLGFPVARRGNEEWKYTDIGPIARSAFRPPSADGLPTSSNIGLKPFTLGGRSWTRLVFVDGKYAERLSHFSDMPANTKLVSLKEAMADKSDLLESHLARKADFENDAFTALNTAFLHDGAFLYIPDGVILEKPIHFMFLAGRQSDSQPGDTFSNPRILVIAGRNSRATIIESHAGLGQGHHFTNTVSEIVLGEGASLDCYRIQEESDEAFHISTTQVELERNSMFSSVAMDAGGGLVRNNLNVALVGEGSSCKLDGLYVVSGSQHVDNQVIIDHRAPHTISRELYKGILDGHSRAVFHGSIIVRRGAQKVDARQIDRNLLLSDKCEADTKPAFWIYADDVKCGHGAANGKLDDDALFYLRSRGLDEETARRFLIRAFASEIINSVKLEPLRAFMEILVSATHSMTQVEGTP